MDEAVTTATPAPKTTPVRAGRALEYQSNATTASTALSIAVRPWVAQPHPTRPRAKTITHVLKTPVMQRQAARFLPPPMEAIAPMVIPALITIAAKTAPAWAMQSRAKAMCAMA